VLNGKKVKAVNESAVVPVPSICPNFMLRTSQSRIPTPGQIN